MTARTAYAAAKAAVQSFSRTWALELAVDGITVNTVAPGPVDTALFALNNPPGSEIRRRKLDRIPVGRLGEPDDIANAVAFFMADASSFVTGQCLYVCGGSSLGSSSFL
jgi:NAD(P)-dependent dehydrogenase (short-subunit alcohol dehydrogenase family)